MISLITAGISLLGSGIKGFFGVKEKQAELIKESINTLNEVNASNAEREKAITAIITKEATSGYWLAAVWRPLLMCVFAGLIISYWFGYAPENLLKPLPENSGVAHIFELVKIGIMGYIPARTVEKIANQINIGAILKRFIDKKL